MANSSKKKATRKPRTKIRFKELLGDIPIKRLADKMKITYTQLYPYKKSGVNPTLLVLEDMAAGLSALSGKEVSVVDLIDVNANKSKGS